MRNIAKKFAIRLLVLPTGQTESVNIVTQERWNSYFSASGQFRLKVRQSHWIQRPRFPIRGWYFGNRSTHSVIFCTFYPEIHHISMSGLLDLISCGTRVTVAKWILSTKFEADPTRPLPRYDTFTSNTLRYIVTLTIDLLTLNGCRKFFVTRSNPPTLSILRPSFLQLRCSHSDWYWQYE